MNAKTDRCHSERIKKFLDRSLSESELAALEDHLGACSACQEELGDQTAAFEWWEKAGRYLRDDDADTEALSDESDASPAKDTSHAIRSVLDALHPTDDPEMLGRLGGLEIAGVVGAGAMGVVLKALDRSLDRTVAVKVLAPHLATSGPARRRFAREAKAAAAVLHPNVMAIHSVSNDESLPYLVMPYYRGISLQTRLNQEGPLPLDEVLRIGLQIAAGLAAAHAQGLIHRDIKPANIMLEEGVERVAITDFGLARAVDDAAMTRTGVIAGTPQYMSPEQARGESLDQRSDLFSLGSVMYAMCTGRPPFRAETSYGVLRRITDEEPRSIRESNAEIPEWMCRVIARLMSKDRGKRFQSASDVVVMLEACLAHVQQPSVVELPEELRRAEPTTRAQRLGPAVWKWIAAAVFSLVMLFAGAVVVLELNKGTLVIESNADDVSLRIRQANTVVEQLTVTREGTKLRVDAGTYRVEIDGEADGITVEDGTVTLERGGTAIVRIARQARAEQSTERKRSQTDESAFFHRVPFELGATRLQNGDRITIEQVRGTGRTMQVGNLYEIRGTYRLASRDKARLLPSVMDEVTHTSLRTIFGLYANQGDLSGWSSAFNNVQLLPPDDGMSKSIVVERGEGRFRVLLYMGRPGKPHVSFYPAGGGEGFGHVYFGTGDSVLKKGWWEGTGDVKSAVRRGMEDR